MTSGLAVPVSRAPHGELLLLGGCDTTAAVKAQYGVGSHGIQLAASAESSQASGGEEEEDGDDEEEDAALMATAADEEAAMITGSRNEVRLLCA